MKVLHLIYDDPGNPWVAGGGAVRAFEIYRELGDRVDATIVSGSYPGARDETVGGVRYRRLGARRPYAWSRLTYAVAASRLLRRARYDAAAFEFSVYTPILLPRKRPIGLVIHHITGPTARERFGGVVGGVVARLERRMLRGAGRISLSAQWGLEQVKPLAPEAALHLVGAGVADEFFAVERRESDFLLFFGRLDLFQKGLDTLLAGYAALRRTRPGSPPLLIAGRGKDAGAVERMAGELGIAEHVRLLGPVTDARRLELLEGARVLLMPSRFEGFGLVAAEAMAAGVPVVAARAGSLPEVVDEPRGGMLVPPDDPAALAAATAALLDDDERRARLSASARDSARRFRWATVAERHLAFLEAVARDS
ncbi:MAG TPA: glycosyltransferase family 4 protein [Longimicrobiales bacterium]|nr:glycosyltransferase family 4 protein [Longimicrobiales bacterium]